MTRPSDLIQHLEAHLGPISGGFSTDAPAREKPFQMVLFDQAPIEDALVVSTLGLSRAPLVNRNNGKPLYMELLMVVRRQDGVRNLPAVVHDIAMSLLAKGSALLQGDVIGPHGPLVAGATVEALYCALPVYFPDSFQQFAPPDGAPSIALVWLVPLTAAEARYRQTHGWDALENELARQDPDLLDFRRPSMKLHE
jgi:hypothetical protein